MQRIALAALLLAAAFSLPAQAQNTARGGGYGGFGAVGGGPDYGGPPAGRRLAVPQPPVGRRGAGICATPRVTCPASAPRGARCLCRLPGGRVQSGRVG
ncbi:hypothetical protein [Enterovirga aerilata]|uniref:Uncharacterized protein n=1 Tax=Enterovirga aerilata TaxID=2730920 RepID=A0A849IBD8_9HYPH|nr:hypothetical protein [Enterovirga sp. DB1703]NNM74601.1 hypothetical protein [Enterovirga sp. DB1703]